MEICCVGLVEQVHFYGCINLVGMCEILDIENFCWTYKFFHGKFFRHVIFFFFFWSWKFFFWTCDFGHGKFFFGHVILVMEKFFWTCDFGHGKFLFSM